MAATSISTEAKLPDEPLAQNLGAPLDRNGFVVIPSTLTPTELAALRTACAEVTQQAREGKWPYVRTLFKQFPPWSTDASNGIWGVQHLLHPDMPFQATFAKSYFSDTIITPITQILDCEENDLIMELYNLLVRPDKDFALRWHRDDIGPQATSQEELERLKEPAWHTQWNLALCDDNSLVVVPGSHKRARTEKERTADPYAHDLPGMKIVEMKAGDLVFYDNNILHRGVYDSSIERMTLHGSVGHIKGKKARARNVLQHGVGQWVDKCDFSKLPEHLKPRAEGMRQRLFQMGRLSGDVGFSQDD